VKGAKPQVKTRVKLQPVAACSVRISCSEPGPDGKMQVDFSYEGDETLVSYLLGSAQLFLDQDICAEDDRRLN
jgi:hypothetical protein